MAKAKDKVIDFSGVKDRGEFNPARVEAGDYAAIITKVQDGEVKGGQNQGTFQYIFTIKLQKHSQNTYPYRCMLAENQLWKLRNIAVAAGLNVPKKRMKFDPNKVVGKLIGVTLEDDEYEKDGKTRYKSEVAAVFAASELADGVEDAPDDDSSGDDGFDEDTPTPATDDDGDEPAEEPKKKKKKDKKGKKKKDGKENVEDLDISDIG